MKYTPPSNAVLGIGSPFSGEVIETGFDDARTVLSATIGDYNGPGGQNVKNDRLSLSYESFQKNAATQVFTSGGAETGTETFVAVQKGTAAVIAWGDYANEYDPVGCCISFYLHSAADVFINSSVSLVSSLSTHLTVQSGYTHHDITIAAKQFIDGTTYLVGSSLGGGEYGWQRKWREDAETSVPENTDSLQATSVSLNTYTSLAAGYHTAHLHLSFVLAENTTPSSTVSFMQFEGDGATTSVVAVYK
jgi:hypothetical protein